MVFVRVASWGSLLVLLPSCGARLGPKAAVTAGDTTFQGEFTSFIGGLDEDQTGDGANALILPLALAGGSNSGSSAAVWNLETGVEFTRFSKQFGFRAGGRVGGVVHGPGGFYSGLRAGPFAWLESQPRHGGATLSLDGIGNINIGGLYAGKPTFGGALTFDVQWDGHINIPSGRALRDAEQRPILAQLRVGRGWSESSTLPSLAGLSVSERRELGAAWLADARQEHASIATFSRLALQLLAVAAPAELVEAAHRAALDEARHARVCFSVASAYLDAAVEPARLPLGDADATCDLEMLAHESLIDGCLGEGLAATLLRRRARAANDSTVSRLLTRIARDEARHARLGWEIVRFCVQRKGSRLRQQLEKACGAFELSAPPESTLLRARGYADAALLDRESARARRALGRRLAALA